MRAFGQNANGGDAGAEGQQQKSEHPRRGACAERESAHALQIARRPEGEQGDGHQGYSPDEILRAANPTRHERFDRRLARRCVHGYSSPQSGLRARCLDYWYACPGNCLASFLRQRQQNPERFRAEWQMKGKAAIRPAGVSQIATFAIAVPATRAVDRPIQGMIQRVQPIKIHATPAGATVPGPGSRTVEFAESRNPATSSRSPGPGSPLVQGAFSPVFLQNCALY